MRASSREKPSGHLEKPTPTRKIGWKRRGLSVSPALSRQFLPFLPFSHPFGGLRAHCGRPDRPRMQEDKPPDVIRRRHHGQGEVGPGLADGANPFATHLLDRGENMLDSGTDPGDTPIPPLLAFGQGVITAALALNVAAVALGLETFFALPTRVAAVGIDLGAGVPAVENYGMGNSSYPTRKLISLFLLI